MTAIRQLRQGGEKLLLEVTGRRKARPARKARKASRAFGKAHGCETEFTVCEAREADAHDSIMTLRVTLGEYTLANLPLPDTPIPVQQKLLTDETARRRKNTLSTIIQRDIARGITSGTVNVPGRCGHPDKSKVKNREVMDEVEREVRSDEMWVYQWSVFRIDGQDFVVVTK